MLKNHKNILFSIIGIIILFFGYWYFVLSKQPAAKSSATSLTTKAAGTTGQQPAQKTYDKQFVSNLQAIQYIDLDASVLETGAYKALSFPEVPFQIDLSIPVGRRNPFLPIGQDTGNGAVINPQVQAGASLVPVDTTATSTVIAATTTVKKIIPKPKAR